MNKTTLSFTLIELLIVIVIIGILATSLIPRLKGMQDKAKYTRVEKDFETFRNALFMAQTNTNLLSCDMTLHTCSACACVLDGQDLSELDENHACKLNRILALRRIEAAAGMYSGALSHMNTDPWGNPYLFDENEGRCYSPSFDPCYSKDTMRTVGPDGLFKSIFNTGSKDDRKIFYPSSRCPEAY